MTRALVVDDDQIRLRRIKDLIEDICDFEIETKQDFSEGKMAIEQDCPLAIAVIDLYLVGEPPQDLGQGIDLIRLVEEKHPEAHCILLSSYKPLIELQVLVKELKRTSIVSFHYNTQSMWGQLRDRIREAIALTEKVPQANSAS